MLAENSDSLPAYIDDKGLHNALKFAENWANDFIGEVEILEMRATKNIGKSDIAGLLVEWRIKKAEAMALD